MTLRDDLQSALGSTYAIERELGGGGMSRVFVGEEVALGRKVAVKVLAPELAAGVSAERFQREIKLAAQLQHPNIVPVHTTGVAAGLPYYTMPFVDGLSLRQRLDRNPGMPIVEALAILKDVARALAYAHDHGIVHRDIKPENILLADEAAVVTDFGIAKALHAARTDAPGGTLTQAGTSIGTPAYMAPEQISADPSVDHRADIYSFGCVAYEMLTGAAPFAHRTPQELYAAHITERPVSLKSRRPDCPDDVAAIVMHCLEKGAANRPQSSRELLRALDVGQSRAGQRAAGKPISRGKVAVISAVAGIALFSALAAYATRERSGADINSLAVLPFENVGGDSANAYFADGMSDELTTELSKMPGLTLASRTSAFRYRGPSIDVKRVGKELDVGAVIEGTVRRSGNRIRLTAQLTNAASGKMLWTDSYEQTVEDIFAVQDSIVQAIVSALKIRLGEQQSRLSAASASQGTRNSEAYDLYLRGRYLWERRGEDAIRQAIKRFESAIALDPGFARAHAGLAMAASVLPMYGPIRSDSITTIGVRAGRKAIELDPNLADAHLGYANNLIYAFNWSEAERHFKLALELEPENATAHQWYGDYLYVNGRLKEALPEVERAAKLDPLSAVMQNDYGTTLLMYGRNAQAATVISRALEIDSAFRFGRANLAVAVAAQGHVDSALALVANDRQGAGSIWSIKFLRQKGLTKEAARRFDVVRQAMAPDADRNRMGMAFLHSAVNNADSTFYWLNKAIDARDGQIFAGSVPCYPAFQFLYSDPRWDSALARMKVGRCRT